MAESGVGANAQFAPRQLILMRRSPALRGPSVHLSPGRRTLRMQPTGNYQCDLGASYLGDGQCQFLVWAPQVRGAGVVLLRDGADAVPMVEEASGYYRLLLSHVAPGTRYRYLLNGDKIRPDPASRYQPEGVHGPSEVVASSFSWTDHDWDNPPSAQYVFYELHAGTFTAEGTLEAILPRLPYLKDLGITAIELMPVAQFPGSRNWGYDGVFPFAVQNSYGGPRALKQLVDAAHREGLAVVLDVVYNHLGPEGNYLRDFGPYFTGQYKTPWGDGLNFDGPDSDEVRRFFIENALYWVTEFHVDALRLDAIHAIVESTARPFVQELAAAVHQRANAHGRRAYVIAESDLNDASIVRPGECGGLGCDASWSDDFHHALHTLLTGERDGYYRDFGRLDQLATAYSEGFTYSGQYSPFRRRRHGNSARGTPAERFVVCAQNHDQIGNRAQGDRLSILVDFESLKLAAGAVLLSPYLPLLFMGEEYGETVPFLYFTSHSDPALIDAVRRGRKEEFAAFARMGDLPDPQHEDTYLRSRLTPEVSLNPSQQSLRFFYRELIRLRKVTPALAHLSVECCRAIPVGEQTLWVRRWYGENEVFLLLHFSSDPADLVLSLPAGQWAKLLHSGDSCWNGPGNLAAQLTVSGGECRISLNPRSFVLYERL
jgi:maltooligosyltrehalose trehalohydrolase